MKERLFSKKPLGRYARDRDVLRTNVLQHQKELLCKEANEDGPFSLKVGTGHQLLCKEENKDGPFSLKVRTGHRIRFLIYRLFSTISNLIFFND